MYDNTFVVRSCFRISRATPGEKPKHAAHTQHNYSRWRAEREHNANSRTRRVSRRLWRAHFICFDSYHQWQWPTGLLRGHAGADKADLTGARKTQRTRFTNNKHDGHRRCNNALRSNQRVWLSSRRASLRGFRVKFCCGNMYNITGIK